MFSRFTASNLGYVGIAVMNGYRRDFFDAFLAAFFIGFFGAFFSGPRTFFHWVLPPSSGPAYGVQQPWIRCTARRRAAFPPARRFFRWPLASTCECLLSALRPSCRNNP